VTEEIRLGYYKDKAGNWQKDRRRIGDDRRNREQSVDHTERRNFFRRKEDRNRLEHEHREMIDEALEDFAKEHDT
jgi:hypothetical protein